MTADPTTSGQAVVQITLGQVYQQVSEMRTDVRDLAGSVRTAITTLGDHETRIRILERRMWMATGVAGVLGAGAGYAVTLWSSAH